MQVAVLLATYNGEKYIGQQLDSLLRQSFSDFLVYVSDDGSTDRTIQIIEDYAKRFPAKFRLIDDENKHKGAALNFMNMLQQVQADYYFFCDQDDVWLEDKMQVTLSALKALELRYPNFPIVVHTDLKVVDERLNVIKDSLWKVMKLNVDLLHRYNYLAICNCVTGCTMAFNARTKDCVYPLPDYPIPMHDFWIAIQVAKYGKIGSVNSPTILYRQHVSNAVGSQPFDKSHVVYRSLHPLLLVKENRERYLFCKSIGYGNLLKYCFCKFLYMIRRIINL